MHYDGILLGFRMFGKVKYIKYNASVAPFVENVCSKFYTKNNLILNIICKY